MLLPLRSKIGRMQNVVYGDLHQVQELMLKDVSTSRASFVD